MSIRECYLYITDLINSNSTNTNQVIEEHTFIRMMRAGTLLWTKDKIKLIEANKSYQRDLLPIIKSVPLTGLKKTNYYRFLRPKDFYHIIGTQVYAKKEKCELTLEGVLVESGNIPNFLIADDTRPNFEWEQTIVDLDNKYIKVYFRDFDINSIDFSYYKLPIEVNIDTGKKDPNGVLMVNVDPEFKDSALIEILNKTALMIAGNISNSNYQALAGLEQISR